MKIPADQVYRTWTGSPALGAASQSYGLTTVNLASWMQGDTLGKSEMMILSKSLMKPITNLCSNWILHPQLSFRYDKWLSLRNEYDLRFEMRICTCVIQPFGSLQVVIRIREWQAAGSRIRQLQTSESRCQNYPFEMINDCLFKWLSFRNDLWLSFREPSRFYRTAVR